MRVNIYPAGQHQLLGSINLEFRCWNISTDLHDSTSVDAKICAYARPSCHNCAVADGQLHAVSSTRVQAQVTAELLGVPHAKYQRQLIEAHNVCARGTQESATDGRQPNFFKPLHKPEYDGSELEASELCT